MKKKKYYIPAIFSFFVIGLGQIIKGDSNRGLKWLLLFYLFLPTLLFGVFMINSRLFVTMLAAAIIVYPLFWLYNMLDALLRKV